MQEVNPETARLRRSARNAQISKCLCSCYSVNPKRGSPIKRLRNELEEEENPSEHNSDSDPNENEQTTLSEYELKRLENIRQNQAFLSFLHLPQLAETLKPKKLGMKKEKTVKEILPVRKSLRLQMKNPKSVVMTVKHSLKGPVPMCPVNLQVGSQLPEALLHLWTEEPMKYDWKSVDLQVYKEDLQNMCVHEEQVMKVVRRWIFSAAFHPCASSLLMAAGDQCGQVGLWNLGASWGNSGVLQFEPHTSLVTSMAFSRSQPSTLITTSYDGTAREGCIERAVFEEVYQSDEGLKCFDFLSHDCTTLLIGDAQGNVAIVDTRTSGTSHESLYALGPKILRSVHVHPMQKQCFVVALGSEAHIYDVRSLQKQLTQAVSVLDGHTRSVSGAYFSPDTGNRVLTKSMDDRLRVFDTSNLMSSSPLMTSIDVGDGHKSSHCWPQGKALWDPKREDCFVLSTLKGPCKIKVFHESGDLVHKFDSPDHLTMCSVIAFHPSRRALLGGDTQGRLHVIA